MGLIGLQVCRELLLILMLQLLRSLMFILHFLNSNLVLGVVSRFVALPGRCYNIYMRILGIDPGTGICGFGVIDIVTKKSSDKNAPVNSVCRGKPKMVDAGVISTPPHTPLPERLLDIYDSLHEIIKMHKPDVISIEKLFFMQNVTTGISVAEARGVVLLVAKQEGLPIFEYSPNEIKKAMTGYGHADKKQMQEMVRLHLNLDKIVKPDDAADALAAAITHSLISKVDLA